MNIVLIVRPQRMVSAAESWCCIYEGLSPFTSSFLYNQLSFFLFFFFSKMKGFNLTGFFPSEFRNLTHLREM